ncbi:MAG: sugar nucleotide-binding protein [Sphaerochaeta sp.]
MKFLVLGCNGMAGHTISLYLRERGHDVLGFDRIESNYVDSIAGDAMDTGFLGKLITEGRFDSVINCIGILNQYAESQKGLATFLNAYLPHFLADVTDGTDTQIIHMSTDCVFSGKTGEYREDDLRDGTTFYDRSKALGELEDNKNITLRNSIVGPDLNSKGIGLLNWFMQQKGEIKGFTKAMWTGQTTLQLAKTMEKAALEKAHGLYNTVPDHSISKFDLLNLANRYLRNDSIIIHPDVTFAVDKSLCRTRFDFGYIIPNYDVMMSELAEWVLEHKAMYPHYIL